MARKPEKVQDDAPVERIVSIPGWVYNLMIDRALEQKRGVKYQIEYELERWGKQMKEESQRAA